MRRRMGRDDRAGALALAGARARAGVCLAALALALAATGGCGGGGGQAAAPTPDGDGAGDAAVAEVAGDDDIDAAADWGSAACPAAAGDVQNAACNAELPGGPCVARIQIDDSAPAPAGGTLVPGTYDLVEQIAYTSPGGATGPLGDATQETIVLAGDGAAFTISGAALTATVTTRQVTTVAVAGAQAKLTMTAACPAPQPSDDDGGAPAQPGVVAYYTAADATLTLYHLQPSGGPVLADSYTRR